METSEEGCRVDKGTSKAAERRGREEAGTHTRTEETWWFWGEESDGGGQVPAIPRAPLGWGWGHGGHHSDPKERWKGWQGA